MNDTNAERPKHMTSADAAGYCHQLTALLHDLEMWQQAHPHIADFRTTGMIDCVRKATRLSDLLVRQDVGPEYRAALEGFRVHVLDMDPTEAARLHQDEENYAATVTAAAAQTD